jgi:hypothetical protein
VNLDNHMSAGRWCCSGTDGNTWWGDTDFNADNWVRGLTYMAEHVSIPSFLTRFELVERAANHGRRERHGAT